VGLGDLVDRCHRAVTRATLAGVRRLRRYADGRARRTILVLGDSHARIFDHWLFLATMPRTRFDVVYVPGGSAIGILNPKSASGARRRFDEALARGPFDAVVVGLGEVDTGHVLWRNVEQQNTTMKVMLARAHGRYFAFLEEVAAHHRLVVLGACLPTVDDYSGSSEHLHVTRATVAADRRARTDLALAFNAGVAAWCRAHNVPLLDSAEAALGPDGLVCVEWTRPGMRDNHYRRWPFAHWLAGRVRRLP
jgi:hypothetical protein